MNADHRRHRRIAADVRHAPRGDELADEQHHDKPMKKFCRGRVVGSVHASFRPCQRTISAYMSSNDDVELRCSAPTLDPPAPLLCGHEYAAATPDVRALSNSWS